MAKKTGKAGPKDAKKILEKVSKGRGFINITHQVLSREDPKMLDLTHQMFMHVMHERSALSLKVKELLVMAVNASLLYYTGTRAHMQLALKAGATKEEVFEAIEVASWPAGIHVLRTCLPIYEEVMNEIKEKGRSHIK
jgi:alkylhydroperoxidase/carboxymuconolactone decarboxylase family protein YurZ